MNEPDAYEYILTGRNDRGKRVTEIVWARSADEAVRTFADHGHTEIVLHTDDNVAPFQHPSKLARTVNPRDFVGFRTRGRFGATLFMVRKFYARSWWIMVFAIVSLAFARGAAGPAMAVEDVWVALLAYPWVIAVVADLASPANAYRRTLRAVLHGRWEDVLRLLPRVRIQLPPFERPLREAQALAGLGRLDEAIDHFRPVADDPAVPHHMYWEFKAVIYTTAREREKALDCVSRAAELAPNNAVALINHALGLLNVRNDVARARERLKEARRHALSDVSGPLCEFAEGLLALKGRRPGDAVELLERSRAALRPFARGYPPIGIVIARIEGNLALAYAATGDPDAAVRMYRKAEPILAAHDALELARCREVLG